MLCISECLMESFVPFGGFLSMPSDIRSTLRISDYFGFLHHICDDKFKLISKVGLYGSVSDPCQSCLPAWSVRMDGVRVQDELKEYNGPRHEIETQNKVTKLFPLLDEVDQKYREYCQQLQIVEATLYVVSGCGVARPYTSLAHLTISRHFQCLRDIINGQIHVARQSLGEQGDSSDRVLPRLRKMQKQLRQQRSLQHLGVSRHSWRLQRGFPEALVSILRA
ncbi:BEL1-like homeodomain protein 3 [Tanacetum coccineum]